MAVTWGVVLIVLSALCWGGQTIAWFSPRTAVRLSLTESEDSVAPAFYADVRGEALWDTMTLWLTIVAGVLLIMGSPAWAYFGLSGGAIYCYFAGRGLITRRQMQLRGLPIGTPEAVRTAFVFLSIWGAMGLITVIAAGVSLT